MTERFLFAGPSLRSDPGAGHGWNLLPPATRGDVAGLFERVEPGLIAVADGHFDHALALSHRELCDAIDRGWRVWGVSGIGAIRAWELRNEGMHGYGRVYRGFARRADQPDDEVVHLHDPRPPYAPVSEALIHLREALAWLRRESALGPAQARRVLIELRRLWFGERTRERFIALLRAVRPAVPDDRLRAMLDRFERFDVKAADLQGFLAVGPWRDGGNQSVISLENPKEQGKGAKAQNRRDVTENELSRASNS